MPNAIDPPAYETVPVQLTRMEGDLKLILFQVTDVSRRVGNLEAQMPLQQSAIQQLQSDARAAAKAVVDADKAREDTAVALEKQTADQVAKAKDAVDGAARQATTSAQQSASIWSPFARTLTVIAALTGAGVLLLMWLRP
jgi:hypothetical protein